MDSGRTITINSASKRIRRRRRDEEEEEEEEGKITPSKHQKVSFTSSTPSSASSSSSSFGELFHKKEKSIKSKVKSKRKTPSDERMEGIIDLVSAQTEIAKEDSKRNQRMEDLLQQNSQRQLEHQHSVIREMCNSNRELALNREELALNRGVLERFLDYEMKKDS